MSLDETYVKALRALKGACFNAEDAWTGWDGDTAEGERRMWAAQDDCAHAARTFLATLEAQR